METEIKLCECGCGKPAPLYKRTRLYAGHVQGQPARFIVGHNADGSTIPHPRGEASPAYKHGHRNTPTYRSWTAMLRRCYNPNWHKYEAYGGRGITVCERWRGKHGFEHFLADMGERPEGKTLDREKVNDNYEPANCRWATQSEQTKNRRPVTDEARRNMSIAHLKHREVAA
jgi:hypothetical protein